jgi:hypothetical protein
MGKEMDSKKYNENGFFITDKILKTQILQLKKELNDSLIEATKKILFNIMPELSVQLPNNYNSLGDFLGLIHQFEIDNKVTKACYEVFPTLPFITSLVNHSLIVNLVKSAGIIFPSVGAIPVIRLDRPNEDFRITPWHRDYWFSFLSENSLVIWFTLPGTEDNMGKLKIIPKAS